MRPSFTPRRAAVLFASFASLSLGCGGSSTTSLASAGPTSSDDSGSGSAQPLGGSGEGGLGPALSDAGGGTGEEDAGTATSTIDASSSDASAGSDGGAGATGAHVAIPMYLDPTQSPLLWSEVFDAGGPVSLLVVSTDSIGPGTSVDSTYTAAITKAHAAGERVLGYTYTNSAGRAIADVEADVNAWYSFYPALDGIFVDEVSDETATASSYYVPLYTFIKAKGADVTVAINPGTMVDEAFMSASDILLTYEDTYANFIDPSQNPPNPAWVAKYPSSRFWNIVLSADATVEANAIALARGRNAGWIYVTAEGPNTAYQDIETGAYWTTEIDDVTAP